VSTGCTKLLILTNLTRRGRDVSKPLRRGRTHSCPITKWVGRDRVFKVEREVVDAGDAGRHGGSTRVAPVTSVVRRPDAASVMGVGSALWCSTAELIPGQRVRAAAEVQDDAFSNVDSRSGFVLRRRTSPRQALRLVLRARSGGRHLADRVLPTVHGFSLATSRGRSVDMGAPGLTVLGGRLALLRVIVNRSPCRRVRSGAGRKFAPLTKISSTGGPDESRQKLTDSFNAITLCDEGALASRFHGGACEGPCRTGRKVL